MATTAAPSMIQTREAISISTLYKKGLQVVPSRDDDILRTKRYPEAAVHEAEQFAYGRVPLNRIVSSRFQRAVGPACELWTKSCRSNDRPVLVKEFRAVCLTAPF